MVKETEYEIFACSAYGSDVLHCDTLDKALERAKEWSMGLIDCDIVINKVETTRVKIFRNGGEIE